MPTIEVKLIEYSAKMQWNLTIYIFSHNFRKYTIHGQYQME